MYSKRKKSVNILSILLSLVIVAGVGFVIWKMVEKPVGAGWFDDGWQYRTRIVITNTGAAVTNQKVKFDIATNSLITAGKIQSDCGDSRFTDSNGQVLRYFLDTSGGACNTASTDYYVLIPSINAGSVVLYHYYGNPGAINGTEGSNFTESTFSPNSTASASEEQHTGPIAYWKFDENSGSTAGDSTSRGNTGTLTNGIWSTKEACVNSNCLFLTGSSSAVTTNLQMSPAQYTNLTMMAWVRPTDIQGAYANVMGGDDGGYDRSFGFATSSYQVQVGNQGWATGVAADIGQWQHLAVVYSPGQITFYKNGVAYNYGSGGSFGTSTQALEIGKDTACGGCHFKGFIDDAVVYGRALSAAEIQKSYRNPGSNGGGSSQVGQTAANTNSSSTLNNGLVGWWQLNEGSGNPNDYSGNGLTITDNGATLGVAGKYGLSRDFNGTSQYGTIADSATLDLPVSANRITVSAWINWDGNTVTDGRYILRKLTASGSGSAPWGVYDMGISNTTNKLFFRISDGVNGGSEATAAGNTTLSSGGWYHIVGTYDGQAIRIYVNGTLDGTTSTTITMGNTAHPLLIGKDTISSNGNNFNGKIDDLRLYNRALPSTEVATLYAFRPDPYVYWNLDEGTGTTANSIGGYNGTAVVDSWTQGKHGKALNMNGTTQYVQHTGVTGFDPAYAFTLEFWVYSTSDSGSIIWGEISSDTTCNGNPQIWKDGSNNITLGRCGNGAGPNVGPSSAFLNNWHHVAFSYDGTNTYAYKNGVLVSSYTFTWPSISAPKFRMGADRGAVLTGLLTGKLDDVRLYTYARTQKEIVSDMNGNHPNVGSPVGSAVAHWKFDEGVDNTCSGGTNDVCNSGSAGSTLNGAQSGMSVPATATSGWTNSGKYNKALLFDGSNDFITVTDTTGSPLDITTNITISGWFKTSTDGRYILTKNEDSFFVVHGYAGTGVCVWYNGLSPATWTCSGTNTTDGSWHHFASVYDGSTLKVFIDGIQKISTPKTGTLSVGNSNMLIGDRGAGHPGLLWNGALDEIKIYNFALTADEIKLDYNRASAIVLGAEDSGSKISGGAGSAPLAYWDFNEKTGTVAFDKSGTGINGTIQGGAQWRTGKFGSALYFDGVDDRVTMGDVTTFDSQLGLSVSLWANISTLGTARRLVSKWITAQSTFMISLDDTNSDELIMAVSDGAHYDVFSTTNANLTTNRWYHIEMTWTNTERAIYVNGVPMTLTTTLDQGITGTNNSSEALQIGDSGETTPFNGYIDEVKIYNYARPQALVAFDYNRGAPIGHWQLDECQGSTAFDSSPNANGGFNGNNGTITIGGSGTYTSAGSCSSGTSTEAWNGGSTGKVNSSLGFDGTDDYIQIPYTSTFAPTVGISFGGWFYTSDKTQSNQSILSKTQGGGYNLFLNNPGGACGSTTSLCGLVNVNSSYAAVDYPVSSLTNNTWYHTMVTFNGSTVRLYLNGKLVNSRNASGAVTYTVSNALCIGGEPGNTVCDAGSPFYGLLDDIRIYNYELSATQIKEVYNNGGLYFGPATGTP